MFDELIYAEVIDPETLEPVSDGERGELVLTHLQKEAQPLLRYRTGDLTVKVETPPIFGRTQCLPRVVFGRTDSMIKVKGVKLFPSEIGTCLLGIPGFDGNFCLIISKKPGGGDRICLKLQGIADDGDLEQLATRFKSQTMLSVDEFETVDELEKSPLVIDKR